ncbi:hypothetical protein FHW58_000426 [Duganella sp. 1224]|uniref:hypothetical protein n=1 Tax=Duganella sp. 1224 TaxID=2587052 RepID=UPI0015CDF352|nr:hypothetical protein [Duganella sp. 1224]NYE59274.1 hypothetical protein [Duganella sp. 1224]
MNKRIVIIALLLAGCGNNPPVPDWQMNAKNGIERATAAYMEGNARVEAAEYQRAREALSSTGKVDLLIRAELTRCAARVAALVFEACPGYDRLAQDAGAADRAYAAYLSGHAGAADIALLPAQHQAAAAAGDPTAAIQAIPDPLSKLVASGVAFRAGKATPQLLANAVDTASAQGWRRPLLAWLGVQAMRAEQAGDSAEAQRIRRRIALSSEPTT